MAPQELEKSASQYATGAIKYDAQGARGMAITNYPCIVMKTNNQIFL